MQVLDSGVLSRFLGVWHPDFFGGPSVQALEREWAAIAGTKHGVSVNSCTSGLYAAVGAVGAGPGDEVIVSPYTMIASATASHLQCRSGLRRYRSRYIHAVGRDDCAQDNAGDQGDHRRPHFRPIR